MKRCLILLLFCSFSLQAQLSSYEYKQALEGVTHDGWHQLTLPITIFDRMHSYSDLRLYGLSATDTIEVPYLITDTVISSKTIRDFIVKNDKGSKHTFIKVSLPETLYLSKIGIHPTASYDYYRSVRIEGITSGVLSSKNDNLYPFVPQLLKNFYIDINNQDNEPLSITELTLYPISYTLTARFPDTVHAYYLAYGKADDAVPQYDIAHFVKDIPKNLSRIGYSDKAERILVAPNTPATTATTTQSTTTDGEFISLKPLLWAVMGIIVLLIFFFSAKMMRKE